MSKSEISTMARKALGIRAYDVADHLKTPEDCVAYLDAWFSDAPDDAASIARVLSDVARAHGMSAIARDAELSYESLYKALSGDRSLDFATVLKVLRALGMQLHVQPAA